MCAPRKPSLQLQCSLALFLSSENCAAWEHWHQLAVSRLPHFCTNHFRVRFCRWGPFWMSKRHWCRWGRCCVKGCFQKCWSLFISYVSNKHTIAVHAVHVLLQRNSRTWMNIGQEILSPLPWLGWPPVASRGFCNKRVASANSADIEPFFRNMIFDICFFL